MRNEPSTPRDDGGEDNIHPIDSARLDLIAATIRIVTYNFPKMNKYIMVPGGGRNVKNIGELIL